jgi:hypothetical protein
MLLCAAGDTHGALDRSTRTCSRSRPTWACGSIRCCTSGTSGSGPTPRASIGRPATTTAPATSRRGGRSAGVRLGRRCSSRATTRTSPGWTRSGPTTCSRVSATCGTATARSSRVASSSPARVAATDPRTTSDPRRPCRAPPAATTPGTSSNTSPQARDRTCCLKGYGLALWRAGRFDEALAVFERMLWLNPTDNQGVRFVLDEVRAGAPWRDEESSP